MISSFEKRIWFGRHAESLHNRDAEKEGGWEQFVEKGLHTHEKYVDADLTSEGVVAVEALRQVLSVEPDLVVCSPLTRAVRTASLLFPGRRIVATDLCRERIAQHTSDKRRGKDVLEIEFPQVDFSSVECCGVDLDFLYNKEHDGPGGLSQRCTARAKKFVEWLMKRPEEKIVVISHSQFWLNMISTQPHEPQDRLKKLELRQVLLKLDKVEIETWKIDARDELLLELEKRYNQAKEEVRLLREEVRLLKGSF